MGCGASSQRPEGGTLAVPGKTPKFRYGSADMSIFGETVDKSTITVGAVFQSGKSTVFLMSVPLRREQLAAYPTDGSTEQQEVKDEAATESKGDAEGEQAGKGTAAPTSTPAGSENPAVRWAIYNDGKADADAKVTCTFFHAEGINVLDASAATEERMEAGRLQVELAVPAAATVAFVEGPIGGYMWKCMIKNFEGSYDVARTYEEAAL